jgi:hypothetical protein
VLRVLKLTPAGAHLGGHANGRVGRRHGPLVRERGSAPKGGAHSTVCFACTAIETPENSFFTDDLLMVRQSTPKVFPRSQISGSARPFLLFGAAVLRHAAVGTKAILCRAAHRGGELGRLPVSLRACASFSPCLSLCPSFYVSPCLSLSLHGPTRQRRQLWLLSEHRAALDDPFDFFKSQRKTMAIARWCSSSRRCRRSSGPGRRRTRVRLIDALLCPSSSAASTFQRHRQAARCRLARVSGFGPHGPLLGYFGFR